MSDCTRTFQTGFDFLLLAQGPAEQQLPQTAPKIQKWRHNTLLERNACLSRDTVTFRGEGGAKRWEEEGKVTGIRTALEQRDEKQTWEKKITLTPSPSRAAKEGMNPGEDPALLPKCWKRG